MTKSLAGRYVHQENHHSNKTDTRGGVYGELNLIKEEHLDKSAGVLESQPWHPDLPGNLRQPLLCSALGETVVMTTGVEAWL